MQIHIIDLKYIVNKDQVANIRPQHREFLDIGYDKGILLASGPKSDKTGGVILAKGSIEEIKKFIRNDPFYVNKIAEYNFSTFDAVKHIKELAKQ